MQSPSEESVKLRETVLKRIKEEETWKRKRKRKSNRKNKMKRKEKGKGETNRTKLENAIQ